MRNLLFGIVVMLVSNGFNFENKIQKDSALEARDAKPECFIELVDGKIISFADLFIKSVPLQYQYLEGDGEKLNYEAKEIKAFQTKKYYAIKIYNQVDHLTGKLPFLELFASRIMNGKIELFSISEMKADAYGPCQSGYVKSYFLRKGEKSKIIPATKANLKNLISDNTSLSEEFESLYKRSYPFKSIMAILNGYN